MPKVSKNWMTFMIIAMCVGSILIIKKSVGNSHKFPPSMNSTKVQGDPAAVLKIVEYIDFECAACSQGASQLMDFIEKNPKAVRLEVKYFPLTIHEHSFEVARYAECAAQQDKFWSVYHLLLERQSQWQKRSNALSIIDAWLKEIGLDSRKLETCLRDEHIDKLILKSKEEGWSLGVRSTPTYFINGEMSVGLYALSDALDKYYAGLYN